MESFQPTLIQRILQVLPDSPFAGRDYTAGIDEQWIRWLNWFFPVSEIIEVLGLWVSALLVIYAYKAIMRIIKIL